MFSVDISACREIQALRVSDGLIALQAKRCPVTEYQTSSLCMHFSVTFSVGLVGHAQDSFVQATRVYNILMPKLRGSILY